MKRYPPDLPAVLITPAVAAALAEDLGAAGDITTLATLAPDATAVAVMNSRQQGVIAGLKLARAAFDAMQAGLVFEALVADGDVVRAGQDIARISGNARAIMSAERVALNYLCHMSGIASHTARFVAAVAGTGAQVCDTRKTTPGLRAFEKYAVRCGGGANHRFGLDDAILIKDNHIAVAGGVRAAVAQARAYAGHLVAIEVEVDRLEQLSEALELGVAALLLDNMSNAQLRAAVALNAGRAKLEASGGVTLETVAAIAATGVDYISTSRITMAAGVLDIGLDIDLAAG
ncbi:carboxylating nicotinate-nucleotide diphosphorylase [Abyssibius alkaniclasticus]|uniref:carboxylating nicotinate-nucleotide diphosphorylase n=1 Tax=Abyssibius alkaniclasticus TaxID=2881234 RepID=UPI002363C9FE|nr:carboxylating nicotinate-nucleotide diphosphorylase [Abyssibius alkaniclasticus]UPH71905.1 carboxylating nicotinate-nucleotide diphosphorylase [Abyssibius alkaniclasticus]